MRNKIMIWLIISLIVALECSCCDRLKEPEVQKEFVSVHTDVKGLSEYLDLPVGTTAVYWVIYDAPLSQYPPRKSDFAIGPSDWGVICVITIQPEKYEEYLRSCGRPGAPQPDIIVGKGYIGKEFKRLLEKDILKYNQASDTYRISAKEVYGLYPKPNTSLPDRLMIPVRSKNAIFILMRSV